MPQNLSDYTDITKGHNSSLPNWQSKVMLISKEAVRANLKSWVFIDGASLKNKALFLSKKVISAVPEPQGYQKSWFAVE